MDRRRDAGVTPPAGSWDLLPPLVLAAESPPDGPSSDAAARSSEPAGVGVRAADFLAPPAFELAGASDLADFRTRVTGTPAASASSGVPALAERGLLAGALDAVPSSPASWRPWWGPRPSPSLGRTFGVATCGTGVFRVRLAAAVPCASSSRASSGEEAAAGRARALRARLAGAVVVARCSRVPVGPRGSVRPGHRCGRLSEGWFALGTRPARRPGPAALPPRCPAGPRPSPARPAPGSRPSLRLPPGLWAADLPRPLGWGLGRLRRLGRLGRLPRRDGRLLLGLAGLPGFRLGGGLRRRRRSAAVSPREHRRLAVGFLATEAPGPARLWLPLTYHPGLVRRRAVGAVGTPRSNQSGAAAAGADPAFAARPRRRGFSTASGWISASTVSWVGPPATWAKPGRASSIPRRCGSNACTTKVRSSLWSPPPGPGEAADPPWPTAGGSTGRRPPPRRPRGRRTRPPCR